MRRLLLVGVAMLAAIAAMSTASLAQSKPEFRLGFKALADQVPDVVGEPIEEERWGANGDSLQQTTTGLMVWRKADNWTAFTDGSRSWINGPLGVRERANEERFDWEIAAPPPGGETPSPTTHTPADGPTATATPGPVGIAPPMDATQPRASDSYPCRPGQIKGNRDSMIYHVPGGQSYDRTRKNVRCFDTEAEAAGEGYRRAYR
ncbi:MAG: sunset domain-containing protein [Chloroflexota bacterium]